MKVKGTFIMFSIFPDKNNVSRFPQNSLGACKSTKYKNNKKKKVVYAFVYALCSLFPSMAETKGKFDFAIDRGGTFTDVFARLPDGRERVLKLLSHDPQNYRDAPTEGIRRVLEEVRRKT